MNAPLHTADIVGRLRGPHEWGYRCITEGAFIEDRTPFEAADIIAEMLGALEGVVRKFDAAPGPVKAVPLGIMKARRAIASARGAA